MTVPNWRTPLREKIVYITPDGVPYNLHDTARGAVLSMTGWGLPTANIADTRGPFQHGASPLSVRIPTREVVLTLRYSGCSREDYLASRLSLVDIMRQNRTNLNNPSAGNLRWYRADGNIYQLDVLVANGPSFAPNTGGWDEWGYTDEIVFTAYNPIIYNPARRTDSFSGLGCVPAETLQFPFTFGTDIVFAGNSCNAINSLIVNYDGTWQTFPLITVVGPATNFRITHQESGLLISLAGYTIAAGDSVVFDLTYDRKTVTLTSSGVSLLGYVTTNSDLGSFAVEPNPIVPDGINTFEVSIDDGSGDTRVVFQYYTRFIGI